MQRITKFSAIIGFLAVMTFAIGLFMYMPTLQDGISASPVDAQAYVSGDGGTGCSNCGGGDGGGGGNRGDSSCHNQPGGCNPCGSRCVPQETPKPVCTLNAYPTTINKGESSTLTWTTSNASSVSINQGIGSVSKNGSTSVSPTETTTYTLTASGNGYTVTCSKTITVKVLTPVCTLTASPTSIKKGESSTLTWTTQNADTASINQGIGSVSLNGNKSVSPTQTTTYVLTASGYGKTVTCEKTITVTEIPGLSCDSFNASPSSFGVGGGTTNLSWNTTGATSVSIDQGIGSVAQDGNMSVGVSNSKTFTLTASNAYNTVTCQTSVSVDTDHGCTSNCGGGGGSSRPSCRFFKASDKDIEAGDRVTLSWETRRADEILIKDNHGEELLDSDDDDDVDEGSLVVYPKKDTTYTLKIEGKNNKTDSCTVKVNVDDEVTVTTVRDRQPVTTITFREVPYTGFDAGPMLAGLFYALLAAWALVASYIVVIKKGSVMGFSLATVGMGKVAAASAPVITRAAVAAPANLPVATEDDEDEEEVVEEEEEVEGEEDSLLQNRAFSSGVILSTDALAAVKRAGTNAHERLTVIDAVITRAKETFAREDGWIALDRARIATLF